MMNLETKYKNAIDAQLKEFHLIYIDRVSNHVKDLKATYTSMKTSESTR